MNKERLVKFKINVLISTKWKKKTKPNRR